jgi:hypothetical protein
MPQLHGEDQMKLKSLSVKVLFMPIRVKLSPLLVVRVK